MGKGLILPGSRQWAPGRMWRESKIIGNTSSWREEEAGRGEEEGREDRRREGGFSRALTRREHLGQSGVSSQVFPLACSSLSTDASLVCPPRYSHWPAPV